mmetsp:Transcript_19729/g.50005  ORF Transcript_19729/g.50005 Transcript_19729/m.50005 type:complete len:104 (+) Transcript_19729:484-795(+)
MIVPRGSLDCDVLGLSEAGDGWIVGANCSGCVTSFGVHASLSTDERDSLEGSGSVFSCPSWRPQIGVGLSHCCRWRDWLRFWDCGIPGGVQLAKREVGVAANL